MVSEIAAAFPGASVGDEEELVCSGSLVAKAVECGLRSLMLEHGWRCVGESIYVDSTFAASEERSDLCAVNVEVTFGRNDYFEFVVSPDAFRFTTHKISDVASSSMMETFQHSKEVILEGCNFQTACTILPTLHKGHVTGFGKIPPSGQCLDKFVVFCSLKHGLEPNCSYHTAVKLTSGASLDKQWLPSSLVLQGSGLQPAPKSFRASKALSALRSFIELLKAWNFFGQNQLVIKEQLLLNRTETQPTWDKAISNLTLHNGRTDNSEVLNSTHTNFMVIDQLLTLDFRTPKPAVLCSSSAKLCSTKVHEIALSLDDDGTGGGTSSINCCSESEPIGLTNSYRSPVTLLKPSFSRCKPAEKNKRRYSSEHSDADSSNKSSRTSLPNSPRESFPKASPANPVNSSSASLLKPVIQVSENPIRKHAEIMEDSCRGIAKVQQQDCFKNRNLDARRKSKDYIPDVPEESKAMPAVGKDVHSTKVLKTKSKSVVGKDEITAAAKIKAKREVDKDELPAATKLKTKPEVVKDEFTKKVIDHQKDELTKKVTKAETKPITGELTSTTQKKTKPDVVKDELTAKVIDHHKRGELRLLTVADLKCFLSAKKAKVGGTKEVLIRRATELLA